MLRIVSICCFAIVFANPSFAAAETSLSHRLGKELAPLVAVVSGQVEQFAMTIEIEAPIDGRRESVRIEIGRSKNGSYHLSATHKDYSFIVQRSAETTSLILPHHQVIYKSTGENTGPSNLAPDGIVSRLISADSALFTHSKLLAIQDPQAIATLLSTFASVEFDEKENEWIIDKKMSAKFSERGHRCLIKSDATGDGESVQIQYNIFDSESLAILNENVGDGFREVLIPRQELEHQLLRGVSRATEILFPGQNLINGPQVSKTVDNGKLIWIDGQRVCILSGSPEEIGTAHGQLLKEEALKTIDSVLYTFGTVNTIRTGRWFRHDLEAAYERLKPHIPEDHKTETATLAAALGIDENLAQTVNVFPELFHCSGFAVFGKATHDGKLYHGRVLDYMTTIGLQDAATNLIISVDGKIPFVNVGYAGFIGSVTGMNEQAISLGEMGGRGEGQWDGVPMATLMRRALEECSTLSEVKSLWKNSPRTCEYYYVFADGKTNEAVGVAATPESIEFINPGQEHERLGEGIEDCVVLSAGSRLEKLRERVQQKHGEIDKDLAIWLMSRPVAMKSNLHNALFIPADGVLYVANADHQHPAAERPYVKIDLKALLKYSREKQSISLSK